LVFHSQKFMQKLKEIPVNANYPDLEKLILERWDKINLLENVKEARKKSPEKIYYDGPITANALPHYGHVITWTMKDVLPRYWTMNNYFVSRNIGWDCQGIPVEYEIEKQLEFKEKKDIERFGIEKFNQLCRESVLKYRDAMKMYELRIGRWMDEKDSYETMDPLYIESVWWSLKTLFEKGLLYEGYKVVPYSTRAGTTLSNAEVGLGGYKEIEDPAITVKFELENQPNTFVLAWTTTPWTIPGNLLLAVHKDIEYVKVKSNHAYYIVAKNALERTFKDVSYEIVGDIKATDLIGLEYVQPLDFFEAKRAEGAFKIVHGDHVTTEEGTGIVHIAPYGVEDFDILTNLKITAFDYLDENAEFTSLVAKYEGQFYKKANKAILEDLETISKLFKQEKYLHQMPMCWRTDTPLIYKPIKSWYVAVTKIKDQLMAENQKINWIPEHVKDGRFGSWLEGARDWALSRSRYWGTPLPVWINDKTGEAKVIGSFRELAELSGKTLEKFDPHKPFVDEIVWGNEAEGFFRRVPDVIDVWYDSGAMPFARYHYPFENKERFEETYPAEYISESVDQTRGWFYSLIVINVALFGKSPYNSVLMSGMLGDETGKKLSKSKGNYKPMDEILDSYGSEVLRYFLLTSPVVRGDTARFSTGILEESKKEFFSLIWNSLRYFATYYNLNPIDVSANYDPQNPLDLWIKGKYATLVKNVTEQMERKEVMMAARNFAPFLDDLSTWYIRRSRDRISSGDPESLATLFEVLLGFSKLIAPFTPFIAEDLYLTLADLMEDKKESVHLELFPKINEKYLTYSKSLDEDMILVRKICSVGSALRKEHNVPVRQPLMDIVVVKDMSLTSDLLELIKDELNVKEVKFSTSSLAGNYKEKEEGGLKVQLNMDINEELEVEGYMREFIREVQKARKDAGVAWDAMIKVEYKPEEKYKKALAKFEKEIKDKTLVEDFVIGESFKVI
jgi:isoleucyl-tRNA synthetase